MAATALAEFIGAAIRLKTRVRYSAFYRSILTAVICTVADKPYSKLEKVIAGFVSLIALAYLAELSMVGDGGVGPRPRLQWRARS